MTDTISERGYAHPERLVSTEWLAENLESPMIRIVESNEDPLVYKAGHIPGAVEIDWVSDLNDPLRRDYINGAKFRELMIRLGISRDTSVVFYGDRNNWWACYSYWVFKLFGHPDCRILDGGSIKWRKERRPTTKTIPDFAPSDYPNVKRLDAEVRAFRDDVLKHISRGGPLVDVRSPQEFTGEKLHMDGYPNEGALRGGHIPGATSIPWSQAVDPESGEFKSASALRQLYSSVIDSAKGSEIVTYCRIGERSSHTWFVLTELLGVPHCRNYDGSWTEWGNSVGVPIEK